MRKYLIIAVIGILLISTGLVFLATEPRNNFDVVSGEVVSADSNLSLNVAGVQQVYDISGAEYLGVTFGKIEDGSAVTVATTKEDLLVGKTVYLEVNKGTSRVSKVYIYR